MKLKLQMRMVYGRALHYPMCEKSKLLSSIGRRKIGTHTFNANDLLLLKQLGYEIEFIPFILEEKTP